MRHRLPQTIYDRHTPAQTIPYIDDGIARGIFYMLYCLFCIVSYRNNTVYAAGHVFLENIRRRFDADYGGYMLYIVGCSYRASYTLSIVYSLVCIVICIDIYDMGRVGGQKYTCYLMYLSTSFLPTYRTATISIRIPASRNRSPVLLSTSIPFWEMDIRQSSQVLFIVQVCC